MSTLTGDITALPEGLVNVLFVDVNLKIFDGSLQITWELAIPYYALELGRRHASVS